MICRLFFINTPAPPETGGEMVSYFLSFKLYSRKQQTICSGLFPSFARRGRGGKD